MGFRQVKNQFLQFSIDDVCSMLNIGKNAAYRLLKEDKLHAFKIGRIWKISKLSVIEYVKYNTKTYA